MSTRLPRHPNTLNNSSGVVQRTGFFETSFDRSTVGWDLAVSGRNPFHVRGHGQNVILALVTVLYEYAPEFKVRSVPFQDIWTALLGFKRECRL